MRQNTDPKEFLKSFNRNPCLKFATEPVTFILPLLTILINSIHTSLVKQIFQQYTLKQKLIHQYLSPKSLY